MINESEFKNEIESWVELVSKPWPRRNGIVHEDPSGTYRNRPSVPLIESGRIITEFMSTFCYC